MHVFKTLKDKSNKAIVWHDKRSCVFSPINRYMNLVGFFFQKRNFTEWSLSICKAEAIFHTWSVPGAYQAKEKDITYIHQQRRGLTLSP